MKKVSFLVFGILLGAVFVFAPHIVNAHQSETEHGHGSTVSNTSQNLDDIKSLREKAQQRRQDLADSAKAKKVEKKDKVRVARCEQKQAKIQEKYSALQDRTTRAGERIQERLERAKTFASQKGLTVPNGDVLVADIASKHQVVEASVDAIRDAAKGFNCQDDNAKEQAELIRAEVQVFRTSIKAYRQSVKAYFSAVIQAFERQPDNTPNSGGARNE